MSHMAMWENRGPDRRNSQEKGFKERTCLYAEGTARTLHGSGGVSRRGSCKKWDWMVRHLCVKIVWDLTVICKYFRFFSE